MSEVKQEVVNRIFREISPAKILIDESRNPRKDYGDIGELMKQIKTIGRIIEPLLVRETSDGFDLIHGFRRMRAWAKLVDEKFVLPTVPVEVLQGELSEEDELLLHFIQNDGKNLTPLEQGSLFSVLKSMSWSIKDISDKVGKTQAHVGNMIMLIEETTDITKELVAKEKVAATEVIRVHRDNQRNPQKVEKILTLATDGGKKKTSKKKTDKASGKELKKQEGRHVYTKVTDQTATSPTKKAILLFFDDCRCAFANTETQKVVFDLLYQDSKGAYYLKLWDFKTPQK